MKKMQKGHLLIYLILSLGAVLMVGPFIWSILTAFKTLTESLRFPPTFLPAHWGWQNFVDVWQALPFTDFFLNTFWMILGRVLISTIISATAGFAFARLKFKGNNLLFMLVLLTMMIPAQVYILPQYLMISKLGLTNTISALIIPGMASAFGTFLMRQFFMSVPDELEEAAELDGCNTLQLFFQVMLPLAKAPLTSLAIFTSLFAWKDLMWPLIVNMSPEKMPLSSRLALLQGQYTTNYPQLMAGSVIATIPMVILFIIFQKRFVQGIASTGSKN